MLDAMQIQSTRSTFANLDQTVEISNSIPNTIMNFGEYYNKLQRLAMYAEQGDYKSM